MYKHIAVALIAIWSTSVWATDYVTEVADIINENCVVCHRQGGIGPMSFETYEQVTTLGTTNTIKSIKKRNATLCV